MQHALDEVGRITDSELVAGLERLVKADRALSVRLLVHLGEVEARSLHRDRSFGSMFDYCTGALGMSEAETYLRLLAARVGRRFPLVLERFGAGSVNLTAIKLLSPHLTKENHVQLLDRVHRMSKRKIEVLVAELAPKPDVPSRVRKLPERRAQHDANTATAGTVPTPGESSAAAACRSMLTPAPSPLAAQPLAAASNATTALPAAAQVEQSTFALQSPRARATSTPLGGGRFKVQVMLSQEGQDILDRLVELLRHQNPSGDIANIVERALQELLKSTIKRRFGQTDAKQPRDTREPTPAKSELEMKTESAGVEGKPERASAKSRYIPRAVLREVCARDNEQCTYVNREGRRCTERGFLEVHHHNTTFARGGDATAENLRLVCRAHNRLFAERDYGRAFMQAKLLEAAARQQQSLIPDFPDTVHQAR